MLSLLKNLKRAAIKDEKMILREMIKDKDKEALAKYCLMRAHAKGYSEISKIIRNYDRLLKLTKRWI